jgi:hypothetical protein
LFGVTAFNNDNKKSGSILIDTDDELVAEEDTQKNDDIVY